MEKPQKKNKKGEHRSHHRLHDQEQVVALLKASAAQSIAITVRVGLGLAAFACLQDIPLTQCQTDSQLKKDYLYQTLTHWLRS